MSNKTLPAPYTRYLAQDLAALERKAIKDADNFDFAKHGVKVDIRLHPNAPAKVCAQVAKLSRKANVTIGAWSEELTEVMELRAKAYAKGITKSESERLLKEASELEDKVFAKSSVTQVPDKFATIAESEKVTIAKPAGKRPRKAKPACVVSTAAIAPVVEDKPAPVVEDKPAPVHSNLVDRTAYARAIGYRGSRAVIVQDGRVVSHRNCKWDKFCEAVRAAAFAEKNPKLDTLQTRQVQPIAVVKPPIQRVCANKQFSANTSDRIASYVGSVAARLTKLLIRLGIAKVRATIEKSICKLTAKVEALEKLS